MPDHLCRCCDDARTVWKRRVCLEAVSKNARGKLDLLDRERQVCEEQDCVTLKTDHMLRVRVETHKPCDSEVSHLLDGTLFVRRLVHALANGSGESRGLHTGDFRWVGNGVRIEGNLSGMTNVGTHREPVFDECQECHAPGYLEGRLCGRIVEAEEQGLIGCEITAAYRFRFDPSEGFQDTAVEGTIEGLLVCPCERTGRCLDLRSFPEASHANPWSIAGYEFRVLDHTGAPAATADVVRWGGHTGLNAGFETGVTLSAPAASVDITLVHFSRPATVTAYDSSMNQLSTETMTVDAAPETLHLTGPGITSLVVSAPQNETLILEICID